MRKFMLAVASAAALLAGISAAAAEGTVKVGLIMPYSGQFADTATQMDNAIKLYVKQHGDRVAADGGSLSAQEVADRLGLSRQAVYKRLQNQQLLAQLSDGQRTQLRMQATVEGLSIAAITYYVVSLLLYAFKALKTSQIEGEMLDRASVQSSLRKHFGLATSAGRARPAERGIAEMMAGLYEKHAAPLSALPCSINTVSCSRHGSAKSVTS